MQDESVEGPGGGHEPAACVLPCVPIAPRTVLAVLWLVGVLVCLSLPVAAAPPQSTTGELPVSLARIRSVLEQPGPRALRLDFPPPLPVPRFEITVERPYMPTFEEHLHKALELTPLQRQSQEWASKCCGLDLGVLFEPIDRALQRRRERKLREQIARELEQLKTARLK